MTTKQTVTFSQKCDACGSTRHGTDRQGPWGAEIAFDKMLVPVRLQPAAMDLCTSCATGVLNWIEHRRGIGREIAA